MANKHQAINGIIAFMDNHMIPKAEGNYKIILRIARSGMAIAPDKIWDAVKKNTLVEMLGVIRGDEVDIDSLARILTDGMGSDEFNLAFKLLGEEYKIYLSGEDIKAVKSYIERS
jgi:hypothetical protein